MEHHELFFNLFGRDYLQCDSLQIIPYEDNSLLHAGRLPAPCSVDQLKAAVLDDVE